MTTITVTYDVKYQYKPRKHKINVRSFPFILKKTCVFLKLNYTFILAQMSYRLRTVMITATVVVFIAMTTGNKASSINLDKPGRSNSNMSVKPSQQWKSRAHSMSSEGERISEETLRHKQ